MTNACDELSETDRTRLIGMIAEGISWRNISKEFGIDHATIYRWAKKHKLASNRAAVKRNMVMSLLDQETYDATDTQQPHLVASSGNAIIDSAAGRDAHIGKLASTTAIKIIKRIDKILESENPDAKDCNALATANAKAWATYAHVNKLDDAPQEKVVIEWIGNE